MSASIVSLSTPGRGPPPRRAGGCSQALLPLPCRPGSTPTTLKIWPSRHVHLLLPLLLPPGDVTSVRFLRCGFHPLCFLALCFYFPLYSAFPSLDCECHEDGTLFGIPGVQDSARHTVVIYKQDCARKEGREEGKPGFSLAEG